MVMSQNTIFINGQKCLVTKIGNIKTILNLKNANLVLHDFDKSKEENIEDTIKGTLNSLTFDLIISYFG